jgi:2-polyprenyl-3-methyl-5-hydroxy-6-metoxy-1,4-benzoquinol methylase
MQSSVDRTSEFFDRYAQGFNAIYGNESTLLNNLVNSLFRKSMYRRYQMTLDGCAPVDGRTVLDIGSGPGHYAVALAQRGAKSVLGTDFAGGMVDLARQHAEAAGVADRCRFIRHNFLTDPIEGKFDYAIAMGFMDYMPDPGFVVEKVLSLTTRRAFFSFPVAGGLLAWQRKLRYRSRCDLFLYTPTMIERLFSGRPGATYRISSIDRDSFVTVDIA